MTVEAQKSSSQEEVTFPLVFSLWSPPLSEACIQRPYKYISTYSIEIRTCVLKSGKFCLNYTSVTPNLASRMCSFLKFNTSVHFYRIRMMRETSRDIVKIKYTACSIASATHERL